MLLLDTNVLLSAADTSDRDHLRYAALLDDRTDVAVTAPVAAETAWMLDARLGAAAEIATLNHRDSRVVRSRYLDAFDLLPRR
jgi:predicted nucleic acid-binding protein